MKAPLPSRGARSYHGLGGTPTYRSWYTMIRRCTDPGDIGWPRYGGRGISVCSEWFDLKAFVRDMGIRPPGLTLDRIDPDGNYEPKNCRWATTLQQNRNRPSLNVMTPMKVRMAKGLVDGGMSQAAVAQELGASQSTISRAVRGKTWGASSAEPQ